MKKPAKVSYYITLLLFVAFGIQAHAQRGLMVSTNGALFNYTNFFDVNVEKMVSALNSVGYGGDDGSFSAKTNQANVFGNYQQQFLGPVLLGSTNLLDKINELQLGKLQQWDVLDFFGESLTWVAEAGDIYFYDGSQLQGMPFPRGLGTEWNIGIIGGQPQWVTNRYAYRDTNNAYAASQDFTGATITVPTQSDGTSNTTAASTAFVMRNRSSGAGSPYAALTNQPNAYSDLQTFAGGAAVGPTNLVTKLASLDSSKQNQDVDLDAVSALSGTGLIARTGSGTATNRSVAGDTEIVVTNGDGVAGNIVLSIGAAIARASALASYQAINSLLTALSGLSGNGILAKTGSGAVTNRTITGDTEIVVANGDGVSGNPTLSAGPGIARTNNPTLTGTVTIPTQSDGTSNTTAASTAFVMRNRGGGGGSGNADTNSSTAWADSTTVSLYNAAVRGALSAAELIVSSISGFTGRWTIPQGGTDATNAAQARINLGLEPDVDVQAFRAPLLQLSLALTASGDMPYRTSGGVISNTPSTSFGRSNLNVADASAGRTLLGVVAASGGTFTGDISVPTESYGAGWSGSSEVPTKGDLYTEIQSIISGGYISSVDTNDLQVNTGRLSIASSVGTGRLVRESQLSSNGISTGVDIQIFTNTAGSSTWTKPANAKLVEILCIGGGGGGASGRRGTNAHAGGGGGGGGGNMFVWTFSAAELGATETVIVGTNGLGAAGQTSDSTDGIAGNPGGNSSVGTVALGGGGPGGGSGLGTGTGAASGQASGQYRGSGGTAGAHASSASAPTLIQDRPGGAAGGGGGGSITTAGATNAAAAGGAIWLTSLVPGGAAGTASGVNGTNGTAFGFSNIPRPGSGGGGGYPGTSTIGIGGDGGWPGGGGGGGAGSKNGTTSGSGGNGASGVVVIKTFF